MKSVDGTNGIKVIDFDEEFNWSRANNVAANETDADLLLFLNNDTEIFTKGFDQVLRGLLDRKEVGAVGALLLYGNGFIQHAGTAVGIGGVASHISVGEAPGDGGYNKINLFDHAVGAVTGAFLAARRDVFEKVGGFDETDLKIAFNDVDFCLGVTKLGYSVIYTPRIGCLHYESISRGDDIIDPVKAARASVEAKFLQAKWGDDLRYDLWYNLTFARSAAPYSAVQMPSASDISEYLARQKHWLSKWRSNFLDSN